MNNQFTIGRHGSFQLRYGWITKGIQAIQANTSTEKLAAVFSADEATVNLGVGKNMVAAIRYWLRATGVIDEQGITDFKGCTYTQISIFNKGRGIFFEH